MKPRIRQRWGVWEVIGLRPSPKLFLTWHEAMEWAGEQVKRWEPPC